MDTRAESGDATTVPSRCARQTGRRRRAVCAVIDADETSFVSCVSWP
jgi:hypothetical protein